MLDNRQWQNRYNHELYNIHKETELTKNIKFRRLQWIGCVMKMNNKWVPMKALEEYTERGRPVGRPRGKWIDVVDRDAKTTLKCKNWRRSAEDRDVWKRRLEQA